MHINPTPFVLIGFCIVALIWSGGHVAWFIALSVIVLLVIVSQIITEVENEKRRQAAYRRRRRGY